VHQKLQTLSLNRGYSYIKKITCHKILPAANNINAQISSFISSFNVTYTENTRN